MKEKENKTNGINIRKERTLFSVCPFGLILRSYMTKNLPHEIAVAAEYYFGFEHSI